ncbi:MAG: hypothetical protein OEV44_00230 [Spirochaetota bacterium]|nr:hypothetical protein [Spirochaetota bacterium]
MKSKSENEEISIEINSYTLPRDGHKLISHIKDYAQKITFITDKYTKGKQVAMILTSDVDGLNAPDYEIYFKNSDLENILEFLLKLKNHGSKNI